MPPVAAPADNAAHLLIVDDDRRIRDLLSRYLLREGYRVTTAINVADARNKLGSLAFDLLVLDVMMPGETGFDLVRTIRTDSNVPILMLTARAETESRIEGLELGADDYLAKPFEARELSLRIANILKRAQPAPKVAESVRFGAFAFHLGTGELRRGDANVRLTDRERDMLRVLAHAPGETIPRLALAGDAASANERAVDVQVNRLRRKIELDPSNPLDRADRARHRLSSGGVTMTTLELGTTTLRRLRSAGSHFMAAWNGLSLWVKRFMPTGLYARSLMIIIAPMVILQSVVAFVFMERHWTTVTRRLSAAVTQDIAGSDRHLPAVSAGRAGRDAAAHRLRSSRARRRLPAGNRLAADRPKTILLAARPGLVGGDRGKQIRRPFWVDTVGNSALVEMRIQLDSSVMRIFARRNAAYASNSHIFLLWMVGTSLVLLGVAILFLRNQIKPILALADAAESFGKGREVADFRPRGAREVRRAAGAFVEMKGRVERTIEQRTIMLAGVSHDLRTLLTRFKLQLALLDDETERPGAQERRR